LKQQQQQRRKECQLAARCTSSNGVSTRLHGIEQQAGGAAATAHKRRKPQAARCTSATTSALDLHQRCC
jgi:hypothetical protein